MPINFCVSKSKEILKNKNLGKYLIYLKARDEESYIEDSVVVDEILINEVSGQLKGSGGRIRYWSNWDAHETLLVPKSYNYKLPDEFLLG
jgi:hypothetical protein